MACEYPNLYKFIFIEGPGDFDGLFATNGSMLDFIGDSRTAKTISEQYGLDYEKTIGVLRSIEIIQ